VRSVIGMLVAVVRCGDRRRHGREQLGELAILMVQVRRCRSSKPVQYVDKLPLKKGYKAAGVQVVPGVGGFGTCADGRDDAVLREHQHTSTRTMIDWATVASLTQIGKRVHLSGSVGIGGCSNRRRPFDGRGDDCSSARAA
jgi:hypothetical protein